MRNVTNVLVVLFLLTGIGFIYAGKGECITPPTESIYEEFFEHYPSGVPMYCERIITTAYPYQYCEGEEGNCVAVWDDDAVNGYSTFQFWEYCEDGEVTDFGEIDKTWTGRMVC